MDYIKNLSPIGSCGFGCASCGKVLESTELALNCPDCGAIFCEECVKDGTFERHQCEDDDIDAE